MPLDNAVICFKGFVNPNVTNNVIQNTINFYLRLTDLVHIHEKERNDLVKRSVKQRKKMDKQQGEIEHYLDDVVIGKPSFNSKFHR